MGITIVLVIVMVVSVLKHSSANIHFLRMKFIEIMVSFMSVILCVCLPNSALLFSPLVFSCDLSVLFPSFSLVRFLHFFPLTLFLSLCLPASLPLSFSPSSGYGETSTAPTPPRCPTDCKEENAPGHHALSSVLLCVVVIDVKFVCPLFVSIPHHIHLSCM